MRLQVILLAGLSIFLTPRMVIGQQSASLPNKNTQLTIYERVEDLFSVRYSGVLFPDHSGAYQFGGNLKISIDNQAFGTKPVNLVKGKKYEITAEFRVRKLPWVNIFKPSATLSWTDTSRNFRQEALDDAAKSDIVIFCGGISAELEGEEMPLEIDGFSHGDRTHINLPKIQEDLLKDLYKTGKPVTFVNFSESAMAMNWEDQNLPAIVQAFYPGETTGTALTRLLFGEINPSGRLPVTFYKSVKDIPEFSNYDMHGRTYRYFKGTPLYPFGYGLSYTTFEYSNLQTKETTITNSEARQFVEPGTFEIEVDGKVPDKNSLIRTIQLTGNTIEIP